MPPKFRQYMVFEVRDALHARMPFHDITVQWDDARHIMQIKMEITLMLHGVPFTARDEHVVTDELLAEKQEMYFDYIASLFATKLVNQLVKQPQLLMPREP